MTFRNFTVGGNYRKGSAEPAFKLQNDSYTELSGNIIGAEDLPINNGIVLANSDHTLIRNNTIQGSTLFTFTPVLTIGKDVTGFGVVTAECLGTTNVNVSDAVTITNNLFTNLWVAAVWLCSDGAGEHEIRDNVFRNNWRGITLREVTDSRIIGNTLVDNRSDGIIVYGAALRNRIESNRVESHVAPSAAAIRIGWVADPIAPLDNRIEGNQLIRDTVAVHVFGARTTQIRNNEIKISGSRTAILLTTATVPGDPATQPRDTEITGNILVFTGPCAAPIGCAIRLSGVTAPVLATDNDWGLRRTADVEGVVWHNRDEEGLGLVTFTPFRNQQPEPTPAAGTTVITGGPPPGVPPFAPLPTPTPVSPEFPPAPPFFSSPTPTPTPVSALPMTGITFPTSPTLAGAGNGSFVTVSLSQGCSYVSWPGATDVSVVDAVQGILPSTARSGAVV
ncbi:MAG: NosD domain-containing protein, partial [Gemmatimonadaceae bacterium]